MYGRYGTDTLNKTLLGVYIGVVIAYTVASFIVSLVAPSNNVASAIIMVIYVVSSISLVFWIFSRMFSRNIVKRRRENEKFCGFFKLQKNKFRDRKTHVYRKCPDCNAVLRLPKSKGNHIVVCPRCKRRFRVRG